MSATVTKKQLQSIINTNLNAYAKETIQLKPYVVASVNHLLKNDHAGLFLAPSLGKTLITLLAFLIRQQRGEVNTLLVTASIRIIHSVWPREIKKWGFPFKCSIMQGTVPQRLKAFNRDVDVYLTNYENLGWLEDQLKGKNRRKFDVCALDESSKIKSTKTKRFKVIKRIATAFKHRQILTGSPIPNGLKDIFAQIFFLDLGKTLGIYITAFLNLYFYPSGYKGYDWQPLPDSEAKIFKLIKPLILRIGNEVLDMPPLHRVNRTIILSDKVRQQYDDLEQEFIAEINDGIIVAENAASKSAKLRQITGGNVYDADGSTINIHEEKVEELKEIIDELQGSPCIVSYEFKHELKVLQKHFPKAPYIGGGVSAKKGDEIAEQWNRGNIPVLFGNPASIAHGLNLQESGRHLIMFSMTWNLEYYEQLYQRLWRQGQKNTVFVIHLIAEGTIDEAMLKAINAKDKTQRAMLDALRAHYNFKTEVNEMEKTQSKFATPHAAVEAEAVTKKKEAVTKKPAAKKKTAKKKTAKKKVTKKKVTAKKKAVSNKGAVNDERVIKKATTLLKRKKGVGSAELMEKLNVSRVTALKIINNLGAEKIAHGVFKL